MQALTETDNKAGQARERWKYNGFQQRFFQPHIPEEILSELLQGETNPNLKTLFANPLIRHLGTFVRKALPRRREILEGPN